MKTKRKTKILSLILAITVVATMIMAVPFTASAADGVDAYAEWYASTAGIGSSLTVAVDETGGTLTESPTFTTDKAGSAASAYPFTPDSSFSWSGFTKKVTGDGSNRLNAIKMEKDTNITINTKFSQNKEKGYASYDLKVVFSNTAKTTDGGITVTGTGGTSTNNFENDNSEKTGTTSWTVKEYNKKEIDCDTITITRQSGENHIIYIGLKYNYPTTEPELNIPENTYNIPTGEEITIVPETKNLTGDVTWESNDESVTVDGGVVKGVKPGQATVTAKSEKDGVQDTCTVIVSNSKTINVSFGRGITNVKIQKQPDGSLEELKTGSNVLEFGTYKITYDMAAPMTYVPDNIPEEFTVGTNLPITSTLALNTKNHEIPSVSFGPEVYNAMYGKTIIWGVEGETWYPASMHVIDSLGQNNIVPIAGAVQGNTEDSDVYMTIKGGKIHAARDGNFQINAPAVLSVPVVEKSVVTVTNYADGTNEHNATYTLGSNESTSAGGSTTYTATAEDAQKGYVEINVTVNGYLQSVTVNTPESPITWGEGETDSGYYDEGGKKGVIRFLQGYTGTATGYGFYIVDKDGKIIESNKIEGNKDLSDAEGIYADLIDIQENNQDSYYMKAYVVVDGKEIWGPHFGGTVNWTRPVEKPTE